MQQVEPPAPSAEPVFQKVQPIQTPAVQQATATVPAAPQSQPQPDVDPLTAAMAEQEAKTEQKAAKSLFEKVPVFPLAASERRSSTPA